MIHPDIDNISRYLLLFPLLQDREIDWHKVLVVVDLFFREKYRYDQNGIANLGSVRGGGGGMKLVALRINEILRQGSGLGL
jgi:hypothetical protein